ncbi:GNAT family N-acetyltransferase [Hydrogenophaga sp.]|uniref:GNAT family N-acetyltransferase n=1 Tax=Hydrogenophaga sp. TaxID=1904254 RepID=UPI00271F251F|nr:GNAT family N-acetyltransferase [Hydrogenophaga sp.]MDO9504997.1 GNAT family N-acetyltransferase [Hydrogenophaga sp.]
MATDLFQSEAWFAHLLAHGFERQPRHFPLPLAPGVCLPLMQQAGGEPLSALSNYYSCLYGPQGDAGTVSPEQWQAAAQAMKALPGGAVLRLQPLDADADWLPQLEGGLRAASYWTDRYFAFGNWYQLVPEGGFAAYWPARPSPLRNSVDRGRRRLDKAGAWRIDIHSQASDALEDAIAAYEAVYAKSWKTPERCPEFMPGLIRLAAHLGWLRLGVLWLNGEPLAAQLWLVCQGKANIYKLAYVQGFEKLSAGSVLTTALMQHTMDVDGVGEVDYLSGDDAYKADWMAARRERVGLVAFDRLSLRGVAAAARHFAAAWWRRRRKA